MALRERGVGVAQRYRRQGHASGRGRTAEPKTVALIGDFHDLARRLQLQDFRVTTVAIAADGSSEKDAIAGADIILLSRAGTKSGPEICRMLRAQGICVPIIVWAGEGSDEEAVLALDAGASDYVSGSIKPAYLFARLRAHLRAYKRHAKVVFHIGPIEFVPEARTMAVGKIRVRLTEKETLLLKRLHIAGGRMVPRDQLLLEIWGSETTTSTHTVETHVHRLRKKMEVLCARVCILKTEYKGYSLETGGQARL